MSKNKHLITIKRMLFNACNNITENRSYEQLMNGQAYCILWVQVIAGITGDEHPCLSSRQILLFGQSQFVFQFIL